MMNLEIAKAKLAEQFEEVDGVKIDFTEPMQSSMITDEISPAL